MKPITPWVRERILEGYRDGEKVWVIAQAWNVSMCTVRQIARAAGISRPTGRPRKGTKQTILTTLSVES